MFRHYETRYERHAWNRIERGFVGNNDGSHLQTPVGTSKSFENHDTGWGTGDDSTNMGREAEIKMRVESNSMWALLSTGSKELFMVTWGRVEDYLVSGVKRVMVDFGKIPVFPPTLQLYSWCMGCKSFFHLRNIRVGIRIREVVWKSVCE